MELRQSGSIDPSEPDASRTLHDFIEVLRKRRYLILTGALTGLVIGGLLALLPRRYESMGSLRIDTGTAGMYRTSSLNMLSGQDSDKIATEVDILQGRTLYLRVAQELDLARNPDFLGKRELKHRNYDDPQTRDLLYREMIKSIKVLHDPKKQLVNIACTTHSPELSAKIVNTLINDYIEYIIQVHFAATQRTSTWLISQLNGLKSNVELDQAKLTDMQAKLGIFGLDEKSASYLAEDSLNALTKAKVEATLNRIMAEARFRHLQESDLNLVEGGTPILGPPGLNSQQGTLIESLRNARATVEANYAHLLAQYGKNYPEVKQAKAELDEVEGEVKTEEKRILNQAKLGYEAADSNEQMIDSALASKRTEVSATRDELVHYVLLRHAYEADRMLYEGLVQRVQEATVTSGLESSEVDIIDLADLPYYPLQPGPTLFLTFGLVGGIMLGGAIAFLIEVLNDEVTDAGQAERILGMPLLGALPHLQRTARSDPAQQVGVELISDPRTPYAEAVQSLRTSLLVGRKSDAVRVLMVTSSQPGEGKTTTARNIAAVLAQHGAKTLLVDIDLRRGRVAANFGVSSRPGLSSVISGASTLSEAIVPTPGLPGMFLLPSGPYPPVPSVQLGSGRLADIVAECRQSFDFVVLDAPPMLGLSDALSVGQLVDAAIIICRVSVSRRRLLTQLRQLVKQTGIKSMGFVYNDIDARSSYYGYLTEYYA